TQDVAYNSMLIERRRALHEHVGDAIESLYADQLEQYLSKLAHHYGRSRNAQKALDYAHRAGEQAKNRSALKEALAQFDAGVSALGRLPGSDDRLGRELDLQLSRGDVLAAMLG